MTNMNMKGSLSSKSSPIPRFLERDYFEEQRLLKLIVSNGIYASHIGTINWDLKEFRMTTEAMLS